MHSIARWLPAFGVALAALLGLLTFRFVDLTPQVDERFFFAPDSAVYRESEALHRKFEDRELLAVTAQSPDIGSELYRHRIERLTHKLQRIHAVLHVTSLTHGPGDLEDLRTGPMWRRLLLLPGVSATNLVLTVDTADKALIGSILRVLHAEERPGFQLSLNGVPYAIDSISRNLRVDFRNFSLAAVAVFGVLMVVLFRSWAVLLGGLTACAVAAFATLLVQQLFGGRIGLLTANLVTITFVLTQSHIVFLTNNWRQLRPRYASDAATLRPALVQTLTASAWCMVAAMLGFCSLLYVEAQPLRELGQGGALATACAIVAAYGIYPWFLLWRPPRGPSKQNDRLRALLAAIPRSSVAAIVVVLALAIGAGVIRIDSDPSLFAYFDASSPIYRSLALVDPHGGSSPLNLAVRRADRKPLDNADSYNRMWRLQRALQEDPAVGSVVSLPVLMAEAERKPLANLLPWNWIIDALSQPTFERVARAFISEDRTQGMYLLRMQETTRHERRTAIIERLTRTVQAQGFEIVAVAGTYALQGRLADLVVRSLVEGLAGLLLAVGLIALAVTRSALAAAAMLACAATVPAVALGLFGAFGIPLDIIATPGINVAVGVAVDSMIHLGAAWRRARASGARDAAATARREQAGGILAFSAVVIAGFSIFAASAFPPTQRFGLTVVLGAVTAGAMALWIFPALLRGRDRTATASARSPSPAALR